MKTAEKYFYDSHCHFMDLTQPDFFVFVNELKNKFGDEAIKFLLSPDSIIDIHNKKAIENVANLLNVMSHTQAEIIQLIEHDLEGRFLISGKQNPVMQDGIFKIRDFRFDKFCLVPLVMDFNVTFKNFKNLYYSTHKTKTVDFYAESMISNVQEFYKTNPDTKIEIYPFLGINPQSYDYGQIKMYLEKYFRDYSPEKRPTKEATATSLFAGLKLYPPLGFDPWPEDDKEREKVGLLYRFAEEKKIPVTTHCDDGGYRIVVPELSWKYSSPERYFEVLKKFPLLKLNFAHLGQQYYRSYGLLKQHKWRSIIYRLMLEFPNVYSDISYSAINKNYYKILSKEIEGFVKEDQRKIVGKILFGSDFNINLNKIKSYTEYLKIFESSALTDDNLFKICHLNPEKFLFES
jgi:hypothetical protein